MSGNLSIYMSGKLPDIWFKTLGICQGSSLTNMYVREAQNGFLSIKWSTGISYWYKRKVMKVIAPKKKVIAPRNLKRLFTKFTTKNWKAKKKIQVSLSGQCCASLNLPVSCLASSQSVAAATLAAPPKQSWTKLISTPWNCQYTRRRAARDERVAPTDRGRLCYVGGWAV